MPRNAHTVQSCSVQHTVQIHKVHTLYIIVGYSIQPQNTHTTVRPVSAAPKIGNRAQSVAARLLENSLQYIVNCGAVWCGVQCSVVLCGVEYSVVWWGVEWSTIQCGVMTVRCGVKSQGL